MKKGDDIAQITRVAFFTGLAIWFGGHIAFFHRSSAEEIRLDDLSVNVFGPVTILIGLFITVRWVWGKMKNRAGPPAS